MELIKVAEAFIEKIRKDYPNDISIVALCGSYVYNDIHHKSDLDFYFIPKTERGYQVAKTFILNDISFDFWGLSWDRATSMANYNEENVSIIVGSQVIYYSSEEDLERFRELQKNGERISKFEFRKKAMVQLEKSYSIYFDMLNDGNDLHRVKLKAIEILRTLSYAIALLNCTFVRRGWGKLLSEICDMNLVPTNFPLLYENILHSYDCKELICKSQQIIINTKALIDSQTEKNTPSDFRNVFNGFYEEEKSYYNKIIHGCEIGDYQTVVLATAALENIIIDFLNKTGTSYNEFPKLLTAINKVSLIEFISLIESHEKCFVDLLKSKNMDIISYECLDSLINDIV